MQNLLNPGITIPIGNGFTIYYYAIIIVFGIICAAVVAGILFKHRNLPADWILDLLLCVLPLGIIGARTFFCLTDPSTSIADWFTKFRDGGLSIIGGVIGGTLGVVLFCLIHKLNFLRVADCVVPGGATLPTRKCTAPRSPILHFNGSPWGYLSTTCRSGTMLSSFMKACSTFSSL